MGGLRQNLRVASNLLYKELYRTFVSFWGDIKYAYGGNSFNHGQTKRGKGLPRCVPLPLLFFLWDYF